MISNFVIKNFTVDDIFMDVMYPKTLSALTDNATATVL